MWGDASFLGSALKYVAETRPYPYVMVDLRPGTPENLSVRSGIPLSTDTYPTLVFSPE